MALKKRAILVSTEDTVKKNGEDFSPKEPVPIRPLLDAYSQAVISAVNKASGAVVHLEVSRHPLLALHPILDGRRPSGSLPL